MNREVRAIELLASDRIDGVPLGFLIKSAEAVIIAPGTAAERVLRPDDPVIIQAWVGDE